MRYFALQYAINQNDYQIIRHQTAENNPTAILKLLLSPWFFNKQQGLNGNTVAVGYIENDIAYCFKQNIAQSLATHYQLIQQPHFIRMKPLAESQKIDGGITYEDGYPLLAQVITNNSQQAESLGFHKAVEHDNVITLYAECAIKNVHPLSSETNRCDILTVYRLGSNSTGFMLDKSKSETLAMTQGDSGQVNTCYFISKIENLDHLELDLTNLDGTVTIAANQNDLTTSLQQAINDNNPSDAVSVLTDNTAMASLGKDEDGLFVYGLNSGQKEGGRIVDNKIMMNKFDSGELMIVGNGVIAQSGNAVNSIVITVQQKATASNLQPQFSLKRLACANNPMPVSQPIAGGEQLTNY